MSRAFRLALLLSTTSVPLVAQAAEDRLARRADSLAALWQEARALADLTDSLAHAVAPPVLDTIIAGSLRVIVNPSPLPIQAAADSAWRALDAEFGGAATRMAAYPIRLVAVEPDTVPRTTPVYQGQEVPWDAPEEQLQQIILVSAPVPQPGNDMEVWLSSTVSPFLTSRTHREAAYLQLVTAPWSVARRCYRGDLDACTIALGLDPSADPAMTWYVTPRERQSVVLAADFMYQNGRTEPDLQRCREGNDSACTALLHQTPVTSLTWPLDNEARQSVLAIALAMGGRDAYERILTHPDLKPGAELALAAGVPTERVVAVWRDSVLAARSRPVQVNLVETMAGLMWIFGFLGLALRSTRWRIG